MNKNNAAFLVLTVAALFWGLFAWLTASISKTSLSPIAFALLTHLAASLLGAGAAFVNKMGIIQFTMRLFSDPSYRKARSYLLKSAVCHSNVLFLIVGFYLLQNKMAGIIVYELYPIIAVVLSYALYGNVLQNKEHPAYVFFLMAISAGGLLLFLCETGTGGVLGGQSAGHRIGLLSVGLGTLLAAFYIIYAKRLTEECSEIAPDDSPAAHTFMTQTIIYAITAAALFAVNLVYLPASESAGLIEHIAASMDYKVAATVLTFSIFAMYGVTVLARVGHAMAGDNHNIYIVWLLSPIFGAFLLWLFGYSELSPVIMLSFVLILVPNLLLNLDIEESFIFKASFIFILLFAIALFFLKGKPASAEIYFNSVNALLVFFALMVGHIMVRLAERAGFREEKFSSFLYAAKSAGKVDAAFVNRIAKMFKASNSLLTREIYRLIRRQGIGRYDYEELHALAYIKGRRYINIGELFVLCIISLLIVGITTFYREDSFLFNAYALIVNVSVVFTLLQVVDRIGFSEYGGGKIITAADNKLGIAMLCVLIAALTVLFLYKHGWNL